MAGLLDALRQYISDSMPGGSLNPEQPAKLSGLLDAGKKQAQYIGGLLDPNSPISQDAQNWHKRTQIGLADQLAGRQTPEAEQAYQTMMQAAGIAPVGMIAWHGSPHKFDKFDLAKIGTGEGKQQQGIGSYLAEAQQVGQKYADKEAWKRGMESGYLYKTDIPEEAVRLMASHDEPFKAQPESVKKAISGMFSKDDSIALKNYHGWDSIDDAPIAAILDAMEISRGNNRSSTAKLLQDAGIPGIRYLDGGSRSAGQGSSNFVVFDPDMIRILERNGQPTGLQPWKPGEWK